MLLDEEPASKGNKGKDRKVRERNWASRYGSLKGRRISRTAGIETKVGERCVIREGEMEE